MKKTALHFLLSLSLLAASSPAFGMVCARNCVQGQARMIACLRACNLAKQSGRAEIGRADCVSLSVVQAPAFAAPVEAAKLEIPVGPALAQPATAPAPAAAPLFSAAQRGPPELPSQVSLSTPSQNAPPAL